MPPVSRIRSTMSKENRSLTRFSNCLSGLPSPLLLPGCSPSGVSAAWPGHPQLQISTSLLSSGKQTPAAISLLRVRSLHQIRFSGNQPASPVYGMPKNCNPGPGAVLLHRPPIRDIGHPFLIIPYILFCYNHRTGIHRSNPYPETPLVNHPYTVNYIV